MKLSTGLILGVAALSLAACGGGTGGGGGMTPPPGSGSNTSLSNLTVSETFPTAAATIKLDRTSSDVVSNVSSDQGGISNNVRLAYDHDNDSYTVIINQNSLSVNTTFTPANETGSTSTILHFVRNFSGYDEQLSIFKPGQTTNRFDYVSLGGWRRLIGTGSPQTFEATFFAFGVRTPVASMPTSGTASYTAGVDGYWTNTDGLFVLGGSIDVMADFLGGTVTGNFDLAGQRTSDNMVRTLGTLTGTATISGNTFGGMVGSGTGTASTYAGNWNGGFFGPSHQEVGGSFNLIDGGNSTNRVVGGFIGN